jgi:DNA-directed RNA polymerase beta subunit
MMERSDKYSVQVSESSGLIDYSDDDTKKYKVPMPYAMKMLIQELQTMSIYPRLEVDTHIANKPVFKYLMNNLMN